MFKKGDMDNAAYQSEDVTSSSIPHVGEGSTEKNPMSADSRPTNEKDEATVTMGPTPKIIHTKPYAGMGKEDLLRFSQTPFWNRLRLACMITFWAVWLALLVTVIVLTIVMPRCASPPSREWWQHSVVYDVHVPSFHDSDGDGTGDIKGVFGKLDYIEDIGVDTIALSPIYVSDYDTGDLGYDVTNHSAIDDRLGSMDDLKALVTEVHKRGMKLIVDFIPNHTSKKHMWFDESRKNRSTNNPYWNFFVWADCTQEESPNNWVSVYGNSSWTWDPIRGQCYFHNFLSDEPELNLRSSGVLNELDDILRFWLTEGQVDGFRIRSASFLFEDGDLKNEPVITDCTIPSSYSCLNHIYTRNQEENVVLVVRWRKLMDLYSSENYRILMVESSDPINETIAFYSGNLLNGAHLPINAEFSKLEAGQCDGRCVRQMADEWLNVMPSGATANWQSSNSEFGRLAPGIDQTFQSAVTLLKMTLPGTTLSYYGEELGMMNGNVSLTTVDPVGQIDPALSRDRFRTPMQWDDSPNAGFTNSTSSHLPINGDYTQVNVKVQNSTEDSALNIFRALTKLRKDQESLKFGGMTYVNTDDNVIAYVRDFNGRDKLLVVINFGDVESTNNLKASDTSLPDQAEVVINSGSSHPRTGDQVSLTQLTLTPRQGVVLKWVYSR